MKTLSAGLITAIIGSLIPMALDAQGTRNSPAPAQRAPLPAALQHSATFRFLASEEGRSLFEATGHPLSKYLNQLYGAPSSTALEAAQGRVPHIAAASQGSDSPAASVPCTG